MANLVNLIGVLYVEAYNFSCEKVHQSIIGIVEKGQEFEKNNDQRKDLQKCLHKMLYFKGTSYAKLGEVSNAFKFLKKDYDYCTKHNEDADRLTTAKTIVQVLASN